jgi:hypothetical protein
MLIPGTYFPGVMMYGPTYNLEKTIDKAPHSP